MKRGILVETLRWMRRSGCCCSTSALLLWLCVSLLNRLLLWVCASSAPRPVQNKAFPATPPTPTHRRSIERCLDNIRAFVVFPGRCCGLRGLVADRSRSFQERLASQRVLRFAKPCKSTIFVPRFSSPRCRKTMYPRPRVVPAF